MPPAEGRDETIGLPDGRRLGVAFYGEPAGAAVLYFHGLPGSRLDLDLPAYDRAAREAGARVVALDRPGFGLSTFQPGRTLLDWPGDVAAAADALGLERFAVVGYSGGAASALVCAARMADRLTATGVVSGAGPPELRGTMAASDRLMTALSRFAPAVAALALRGARWAAVHRPRVARATVAGEFSPAARALLEQPAVADLLNRTFLEAMRAGPRGCVQGWALGGMPWGFEVGDVESRVLIWHGSDDAVVPARHAELMAAAIPRADLTIWPREGHLHASDRWAEVLSALAQ